MSAVLDYIVERLEEKSTWLGIFGLLCSAGAHISPENITTIVTAGTTVVSAVAAFLPDAQPKS